MWPSASITKPVPVASPPWSVPNGELEALALSSRAHVHDAGRVALVDVVRGEALLGRLRGVAALADGLATGACWTTVVVVPSPVADVEREQRDGDDGAADQRGDEGGAEERAHATSRVCSEALNAS